MPERLFQVDLGYACFGIVSVNDVVTEAADIGKWMIGKSLQEIRPWLIKRKAKVSEVKNA